MSDGSKIEWTDATWPVVVGCDDESPGCLYCYSKRDSHRLAGNPNPKIGGVYAGTTERRSGAGPIRWTGLIRPLPDRLDWPLKWKKKRRVFVCNMSDLFHEAVPFAFIDQVFAIMALCRWHTYQVLTKRVRRMSGYFAEPNRRDLLCAAIEKQGWRSNGGLNWLLNGPGSGTAAGTIKGIQDGWLWPLPNVWLGVSVEDQARKTRIDQLRTIPAAVRFLSLEPLLEDLGMLDLSGIGWVIVGGESGPGARPCYTDWIRSIVRQCQGAGVPVFVKQIGADPRFNEAEIWGGLTDIRRFDRKGGDPSEWPSDLNVRQMPILAGSTP